MACHDFGMQPTPHGIWGCCGRADDGDGIWYLALEPSLLEEAWHEVPPGPARGHLVPSLLASDLNRSDLLCSALISAARMSAALISAGLILSPLIT